MPVFTKEQGALTRTYEVAALNIDAPSDLASYEEFQQWQYYVAQISLGKAIKIFGDAVDQFHDMAQNGASDEKSLHERHSLLEAIHELVQKIDKATNNLEIKRNDQDSYIGLGIKVVIGLMNDLQANPENIKKWEERAENNSDIPKKFYFEIDELTQARPTFYHK